MKNEKMPVVFVTRSLTCLFLPCIFLSCLGAVCNVLDINANGTSKYAHELNLNYNINPIIIIAYICIHVYM